MNPAQSSVILPSPAAPFAPQKAPMFLVDTLLSVTGGDAVAEACVRKEWPFVDDSGALDDLAFLELIAQTKAVHYGYSTRHHPGPLARGLLLGARNLEIRGAARAGDRLTIRIVQTSFFDEYIVLNGIVEREGEVLAAGEIRVWENAGSRQE